MLFPVFSRKKVQRRVVPQWSWLLKSASENFPYILEFKTYDKEDEEGLKDTVQAALAQIEEKQYEASLIAKGISAERVRKYGFAFEGKKI